MSEICRNGDYQLPVISLSFHHDCQSKDVAPYQRCSRRWVWRGRRSMCVIQLILQRDSVPSVMVDLNS